MISTVCPKKAPPNLSLPGSSSRFSRRFLDPAFIFSSQVHPQFMFVSRVSTGKQTNRFCDHGCRDTGWLFLSSGARARFAKPLLYAETGQTVNIFSFACSVVLDATFQLCLSCAHAAWTVRKNQGHGCAPAEVFTHSEIWDSYDFYISWTIILLLLFF